MSIIEWRGSQQSYPCICSVLRCSLHSSTQTWNTFWSWVKHQDQGVPCLLMGLLRNQQPKLGLTRREKTWATFGPGVRMLRGLLSLWPHTLAGTQQLCIWLLSLPDNELGFTLVGILVLITQMQRVCVKVSSSLSRSCPFRLGLSNLFLKYNGDFWNTQKTDLTLFSLQCDYYTLFKWLLY